MIPSPKHHDAAADIVELIRQSGRKVTTKSPAGWMVQCPAHEDGRPSLSVDRIPGSAVLRCFAGCTTEAICEALGVEYKFVFDDPKEGITYRYPGGRVVKRYASAKSSKEFAQSGNMKDKSLYLPEGVDLAAALERKATIYVSEGEKDADSLAREAGVVAVANAMGTSWKNSDWSVIYGESPVIIVADNDEPGIKRARALRDHLLSHVPRAYVVTAKSGKDATEHLLAGHKVNELIPMIFPAEGSVSERQSVKFRTGAEPILAVHWAWRGIVPIGVITLIAGRGDVGKSTFSLWLAAQFQQGLLPGAFYGKPTSVLMISHEDDWNRVVLPRLKANGGDLTNSEHGFNQMYLPTQEDESGERVPELPMDIDAIRVGLEQTKAKVLLIDPLLSLLGDGLSADRARDVRTALAPLDSLAKEMNVAVIGLAHLNKNTSATSTDRMTGSHAWRDVARSTMMFARDLDTDTTIISNEKNNYAQERKSYHFKMHTTRVITSEPNDDDEYFTEVGQVEWLGESERSVADVQADEVNIKGGGDVRAAVLVYLREAATPVAMTEICDQVGDETGATAANIRQIVARMVKKGLVDKKERGMYSTPSYRKDDAGPDVTLGPVCVWCGIPLHPSLVTQGIAIHPMCEEERNAASAAS